MSKVNFSVNLIAILIGMCQAKNSAPPLLGTRIRNRVYGESLLYRRTDRRDPFRKKVMKGKNFCFVLFLALMLTCMSVSTAFAQSTMVEKNLFSPDRRPPGDESTARSSAQNLSGLPPQSIQLDGVFIHENHQRSALLRVRMQFLGNTSGAGRNPFPYLTVHEGSWVGPFQVVKIDPSSVTLARNGQQFVISLFAAGKVVPPAAPLPALPAAGTAAHNKQLKKSVATPAGSPPPSRGLPAVGPATGKGGGRGTSHAVRADRQQPRPGAN